MKASEMTNEQLAIYLTAQSNFLRVQDAKDALLEAAARLRKVTIRTDNSAVIAELQRRLKVAEDALTNLQARLVSSVYDGTMDSHEALRITENALAAIREEGALSE